VRRAALPVVRKRTNPAEPAGDSHNFGRRVQLGARWVEKPRTLFWERVLLGAESPLRSALLSAAQEAGLPDGTFAFLPELRFAGMARAGGRVERLELAPIRAGSRKVRLEIATAAGRALAFFSWFGVSDLHWENLVLGRDARGQVVLSPIDVEMILADLALPTETKLVPDADPEYADECRHAAGMRRVLPYLGKPVPAAELLVLLAAYRELLTLLDRNAPLLAGVLRGLSDTLEAPIRVCLRSTSEYLRPPAALWPPLLAAEAEQLARGDVPYFFRLYGQPGIRYYRNRSLREHAVLPLRGDVPKLDPILQLSRNLRSPRRKKLREDGLFALLGAFDHAGLQGRHAYGELAVSVGARRWVIELPGGDELSTARDLGGVVESLYLPCRCGEVRSVFVPRVTRCEARRTIGRDERRGPRRPL
jgi:hypothetical protein